MIVANGVLNAPDYTRTCTCGYQNQTSLALVHAPEMDMWTVNHVAHLSKPGDEIKRIGLNLGAPGDRVDAEGTLWIDYPAVGGDSVALDVQLKGEAKYYSRNSLTYSGSAEPWIGSSGVENLTEIVVPLAVKGIPAAHTYRIQDGANDVEERADGTIYVDSSDLELVEDEGTQVVGLRFPQIDIEPGKTIVRAHVQFTCDEVSKDKAELSVGVEDADDAAAFAGEAKNVSSRKLLTPLAWAAAAWEKEGEAGDKQQTPDLTPAIQQIISRAGWKSGNAIAIAIKGNGKRIAEAFEGEAAKAPQLIIQTESQPEPRTAQAHVVRLYFAEPNGSAHVGDRVFDVRIGDQIVESNFDVVQVAGGSHTTIVREYDVELADQLTVQFVPKAGQPVISGIEIVRK